MCRQPNEVRRAGAGRSDRRERQLGIIRPGYIAPHSEKEISSCADRSE